MTGKLIVSMDFELGWGSLENRLWENRARTGVYSDLRERLPLLLRQLDVLDFPVTWAFVGAMVDEPGSRDFDHLPDTGRILTNDFISRAPTDACDGRDLMDRIIASTASHKLACHSYSHLRFNFNGFDKQCADQDIKQFTRVCRKLNISVDSMVFPQNIEGYHAVLAQNGIRRARSAAVPVCGSSMGRYAGLFCSMAFPPPMSRSDPLKCSLIRETGSMLFNSGASKPHRLPLVYMQALRGLNSAISSQSIFHLWLHPFNLVESKGLFPWFTRFLGKACKLRDRGLIAIETF